MSRDSDNNTHTAEFDDTRCIAETTKAILVVIEGGEHWIPQSVVDDDSEVYRKGDTGKLVVSEWWALKAGLI